MADQGIMVFRYHSIVELESARIGLEAMGEVEVTGVEYEVKWVVS